MFECDQALSRRLQDAEDLDSLVLADRNDEANAPAANTRVLIAPLKICDGSIMLVDRDHRLV